MDHDHDFHSFNFLLKEVFFRWIFDIDIRPEDLFTNQPENMGTTKRNPSNTSQQRIYTTLAKQHLSLFRMITTCRIFSVCCSGVFAYGGHTRLVATRKRSNNRFFVQNEPGPRSKPAAFERNEGLMESVDSWFWSGISTDLSYSSRWWFRNPANNLGCIKPGK